LRRHSVKESQCFRLLQVLIVKHKAIVIMTESRQMSTEINFSPSDLLWSALKSPLDSTPEKILIFESVGGRPLTLASNYPYELWLDGCFIGDGGHRCVPGEALADVWEMAAEASTIQVRLHWIDPLQTDVLYRCLFNDPFFAELPASKPWTCFVDNSVKFAAQCSAQLPRQTIVLPHSPLSTESVALQPASLSQPWKILAPPIKRSHYIPVQPQLIHSHSLPTQADGNFQPESSEDLALYVREQRPCSLQCDTYDLGQIALHRFAIETRESSCILYYSEVSTFEEVDSTRFRAKVRLADAIGAGIQSATPFGTRGCRYVHVLYPATVTTKPSIQTWRREYPLQWKFIQLVSNSAASAAIIDACRANLTACVDGGAVDTCWRERAQWTGDLRMSALALRSLTGNAEVIDLALHQIAQSYNPQTGLVKAVWPALRPGEGFQIPQFHLAFCLTALEHDPELQRDPLVHQVVHDSFSAWQRYYLRDGLVQGMQGWQFTDWDSIDPAVAGRDETVDLNLMPHAVCNAWWNEWCSLIAPDCMVKSEDYDKAFWMGQAYALTTNKSRDSPHATAAALNSSVSSNHRQESLNYLEQEIAADRLTSRVTPYFAYFVALALRQISKARTLTFIEKFYEPIVRTYGSIYEKTSGDASLAHGWSVGIASLLVEDNNMTK
jgi:Bacterial alpha-L-rhamnosidase 6 hairpin glycosidase domain